MNKNALFYGVALIAASSFISCKSNEGGVAVSLHCSSRRPHHGSSQSPNGLVADSNPALIRKLCKSLSGSRRIRKSVFKTSLSFTHESSSLTCDGANGPPLPLETADADRE